MPTLRGSTQRWPDGFASDRDVLQVIDTIPGVGRRTAETIVAEMGTDMDRFATPGHLASWAGVSPGTTAVPTSPSEAGPKGNASLQSALVEAARAAARTKTYLGAQYHRLARRIGANRAAMAVAHSIAVMLHSIIKNKVPFVDMGHKYFEVRDKTAVTRRAVRQLERLGHKVILQAA